MTKLDSFPVASLIQESHHGLLSLDVAEKLVRCISESQVKSCLLKKKVGNFQEKRIPNNWKLQNCSKMLSNEFSKKTVIQIQFSSNFRCKKGQPLTGKKTCEAAGLTSGHWRVCRYVWYRGCNAVMPLLVLPNFWGFTSAMKFLQPLADIHSIIPIRTFPYVTFATYRNGWKMIWGF